MEGSSSTVPNLLCDEDKSCVNEDDQHNLGSQLRDLVYEDDYLQMLVQKERTLPSIYSASSSNYPSWLKNSRSLAIIWILNAKDSFGFKNQTAYLSVIYLDRFLSRRYIYEHQAWAVALLAVASLSLAAKMDECKVPALSEYQVPYYVFNGNVIQNMELLVLTTLEWKMSFVTPFVYIDYLVNKLGDQEIRQDHDDLISKATELIMALIKESDSIEVYRPLVVAAAAVLAASDWQLTQEALKLKISIVSLWEISDIQLKQQQEEQLVSCYSIMQRLCSKNIPSTPNLTEVDRSATPSLAGTKRKLTFSDRGQNPDLPDNEDRV